MLGEKWDDSDLNGSQVHCSKQMPSQAEVSITVKDTVHLLFKKPDVSLGQTLEAFASCIVGPNYFWCQFANSEQLDQICHVAQEYGNSKETQSIQMDCLGPGSTCLARFPDDLMWYRAWVIKKCNDTVSVLFIDFGNESDIHESSLKELPCDLLESPPQAFLCQLEGFAPSEGSWDDTAANHFYEMLVDKPLKVIVHGIENTSDPNMPPYYVEIEMQQMLVNKLMRNFWRTSLRRDENSAEVPSGDIALTSEDSQMSETGGDKELRANGDLPVVLDSTDVIAKRPIRMDSLSENHKGIYESETVPVVSVEQTLSHTEDSRKDTEDAASDKGLYIHIICV